MSVLDPFYEKMEVVVDHLASAAKQIPDDKTEWKPCDKSLEWLFLIHHTGTHRRMILRLFKGEPSNFPGCYAEARQETASGRETAIFLRETWAEFKTYLQSKPEDYAKSIISSPWGGPDLTVEQIAWWVYEECVHHRGQAWVYARMNGITPPSIWGSENI
ncbi:hypothetical protein MNBD_NITROSPINAE04-180 [hydrothermal vent metagenome]|uniref:DinB-like domain-containing protein n=1 Tax=hydrothermal vent metagenome TaxID=652676 RepID=A0A3B1CBK6_9ZZZZ